MPKGIMGNGGSWSFIEALVVSTSLSETAQTNLFLLALFLLVNNVIRNQSQIVSIHNTIRHCRGRFYAFPGQPFSKQLYCTFFGRFLGQLKVVVLAKINPVRNYFLKIMFYFQTFFLRQTCSLVDCSQLILEKTIGVTECVKQKRSISLFTITAEFHARSLASLYGQYANRHDPQLL